MDNTRKAFSENEKLILYAEVDAICPKCTNGLIYKKAEKLHKKFEIAHIYPLNPTAEEEALLKNEEKLSSDPNNLDNLICLCVECHTKFDKPRSIIEYRDLINKKKEMIRKSREKAIWNDSKIEDEILRIIDYLSNEDVININTEILIYDPKEIDNKINNSITILTKRNIHQNVQDYYMLIKEKFREIDTITPLTTETIASQIKTHYLQLKKQDNNNTQKNIFDGMVAWIKKKTNQTSDEASEIIVSYFIQNCEIFEGSIQTST